jgi:hypothetical protein
MQEEAGVEGVEEEDEVDDSYIAGDELKAMAPTKLEELDNSLRMIALRNQGFEQSMQQHQERQKQRLM